jgi:hypothetical protein
LFDGLSASQASGVKVNSATELAELCRDAEIRKTLRAHSLVEKVRCPEFVFAVFQIHRKFVRFFKL